MRVHQMTTSIISVCAVLFAPALGLAQSATDAAAGADVVGTLVAATNQTAEPAKPETLDYHVLDMPIPAFFKMLQADSGQKISATPDVAGHIKDARLTGTAHDIMLQVSAAHSLDVFAYDGVIHVSRDADAVTQLVPLEGLPSDRASLALQQSGLSLDGNRIKTVADGNALLISGPPDYVAIAKAILVVTPPVAETYQARSAVRVRRGSETTLEYFGAAGMVEDNQVVSPATPPAEAAPEPETAEVASDE